MTTTNRQAPSILAIDGVDHLLAWKPVLDRVVHDKRVGGLRCATTAWRAFAAAVDRRRADEAAAEPISRLKATRLGLAMMRFREDMRPNFIRMLRSAAAGIKLAAHGDQDGVDILVAALRDAIEQIRDGARL